MVKIVFNGELWYWRCLPVGLYYYQRVSCSVSQLIASTLLIPRKLSSCFLFIETVHQYDFVSKSLQGNNELLVHSSLLQKEM
jgi:hypothetical protein